MFSIDSFWMKKKHETLFGLVHTRAHTHTFTHTHTQEKKKKKTKKNDDDDFRFVDDVVEGVFFFVVVPGEKMDVREEE